MSNPLSLNDKTGFLESAGNISPSTFASTKKLKLLEIAKDLSRKNGTIPNINELCEMVGIDHSTFYRHIKIDEAFREGWNEVLLNVEANIQTKMSEFAMRPGNYMDRITILRRVAPERWNPEHKITVERTEVVNKLYSDAVEAEIIDPKPDA